MNVLNLKFLQPLLPLGLAALLVGATVSGGLEAQQGGAQELGLLLRQLDGVKRVLMIAAHPDDEDTALLAALARGHGVQTAYLSLTRGEGGQNLIGPELGEGLGVVRTGELLAARRIDGGKQFFTRAFDFGFSKRADEALSLWPEEDLLEDVVWVVRSFRPHIIVSVFSGTPADGHGQHQAAGIMAHRAFDAAADPTLYPHHAQWGAGPWQATKLYRRAWFDESGATSSVATGAYDPLLGRSHFQAAMDSRSQHRSQDMGVAQPLGPQVSNVELVRARDVPQAGDGMASLMALEGDGFFAGVDTALASVVGSAGSDGEAAVQAYRSRIGEAVAAFDPYRPSASAGPLLDAAERLDVLLLGAEPGSDAARTLAERRTTVSRAALRALGAVWDVRASQDLVVPGEPFRIDVEVWNTGDHDWASAQVRLTLPEGALAVETEPPQRRTRFFGPAPAPPQVPDESAAWSADAVVALDNTTAGAFERRSFWIRLAPDTPPSRLYYLREAMDGARYRWPADPGLRARPRNPDPFRAGLEVTAQDVTVAEESPARYRGVDQALGEFSKPVLIAPALSVAVAPEIMVWPSGSADPRPMQVTVRNLSTSHRSGTLRLDLPDGLRAEPEGHPFTLSGQGAEATFSFELLSTGTPPEGEHVVRAIAELADGAGAYDERVDVIDYEHIPRTLLFYPATTRVSVFSVRVAEGLDLAYVMGSGDRVPAAIRQLGIEPVMLGAEDLATGDLSRFDVIVLGVRAYEARDDVRQYNQRLLDYAEGGGTLVVQYNQYQWSNGDYAPGPVSISRPHDRVSVEEAPVTILDPDSPVLGVPNRITDADFEGWVQERGLYFPSEWDEIFQPVLEMNDPGEDPKRGSVLVAPVGEGTYVYTGLSFFRQLPAGVPGAYRLFANLISLQRRGVS